MKKSLIYESILMKRLTKLILNMLAYSNDLGFTDHTRNIKSTIEKGTIKQTMACICFHQFLYEIRWTLCHLIGLRHINI